MDQQHQTRTVSFMNNVIVIEFVFLILTFTQSLYGGGGGGCLKCRPFLIIVLIIIVVLSSSYWPLHTI